MKVVVSTIAGLAVMVGAATAADMPPVQPVETVYASAEYDWNGFYAGVNGGYGGGEFLHPFSIDFVDPPDTTNLATGSLDVTASGFTYGVQAGFNAQMDNILFGLEGDIQGSTIDGQVSLAITPNFPGPDDDTFEFEAGTSLDWFATLRPRLGVVNDRFVVYATGGLAYGQTTSSVGGWDDGTEIFYEEEMLDRWGYTVGAGVEYAMTDNITFKTEYLFTDLGQEEVVAGTLFDAFGGSVDGSLDSAIAFHNVRAGVNFQF